MTQPGRTDVDVRSPETWYDAAADVLPPPAPSSSSAAAVGGGGGGGGGGRLAAPAPPPSPAASGGGVGAGVVGGATAPLLPREREDLAELRSLLPLLRDVRDERAADAEVGGGRGGGGGGSVSRRRTSRERPRSAAGGGNEDEEGGQEDTSSSSSSSASSCGDSSDDGGDCEGGYVKLSRDVYSLLYFTLPFSASFFFALFTFGFQIWILALILVDIVDPTSPNPLHIPSNVSTVVRVSQFLAVLIAVATQDDLITSINVLHTGYSDGAIRGKNHGGSRWQWTLSLTCCFIEGALCLAVTFILVMQSDDVIGLFLDFLAVTFVSELDDVTFALAKDGYFSKRLQRETMEVLKVRVPQSNTKSQWFRPLVFLCVSAGMLSGWYLIARRQITGRYLSCQKIAVQFGDEFRATLGFFSSAYGVSGFDSGGRPVYTERGPALESGMYRRAMFSYCDDENAWTFSFPDDDDDVGAPMDPCSWYAKSAETYSYDIMVIEPSDWYAYGTKSKGAVPFQHFSLLCLDCEYGSERGSCSDAGTCVDNRCVCDEGRYGLNCEFEEPCPYVGVDTSGGGFPGPEVWSDEYEILYLRDGETRAKVYERPVYSSEYEYGSHHVIMFTGRRWIVSTSRDLMNTSDPVPSWYLADFLTNSFHAHWTRYRSEFVSSPADVVTPTDAATPVGLHWFRTKSYNRGADTNFAVDTQLLCGVCDDVTNPCSNSGTCVDGTCSCPYGTFGALCQIKNFVLCRSVVVQFGDELVSYLGTFSGVYDLANHTINGRSVYVARGLGRAMFAYCEEETAWTFTVLPPPPGGNSSLHGGGTGDPCSEWRAMSRPTEAYDIASLDDRWYVRRSLDTDDGVPMERFRLSCSDCGRDRRRRPCGGYGRCDEGGGCVCDGGRYGLACQLYEPCEELEIDSSGGVRWPAKFGALRDDGGGYVEVYHRPVYVSAAANRTFHMILFTGSRWIMTKSETHALLGNGTTTTGELADYLADDFHGYFSDYEVDFISEAVYINTILDTPSPLDLKWYETNAFDHKRPDLKEPLTTAPRCARCNNLDYPCYNKGSCVNGTCICRYGTFGSACQVDSVCLSLTVQFGDELQDPLPSRSGIYIIKRGPNSTFSERPVYIMEEGRGMLAYCSEMQSWTFTLWTNQDSSDVIEPCSDWTAKSSPTYSYDILAVSKWYVQKNATHLVALLPASFSYACNED